MSVDQATKYPQHEKLAAVKDESQAIGEFLDFGLRRLGGGMAIYERVEFECECSGCQQGDPLRWHTYEELTPGLPVRKERWVPTPRSIQSMLAEWFEIDEQALAREKESMVEEMRQFNSSQMDLSGVLEGSRLGQEES
jgi:hypothetical protein